MSQPMAAGGLIRLACGPGEISGLLEYDETALEIILERHPDLDGIGGVGTGSVYRGVVRRLLPAIGAAFVDIGQGADAFLDDAAGLTQGRRLLVQVTRPASPDKPPALSRRIQLAGAFLVLAPGRPGIEVSRRMGPAIREALLPPLSAALGPQDGLILRTAAAAAPVAALLADLRHLQARAAAIGGAAAGDTGGEDRPGPAEPTPEWPDRAIENLLPLLARERPHEILVDDRPVLTRLAGLLAARLPGVDIPTTLGPAQRPWVADAIEGALAAEVPLRAGGRLIVERASAGTVIDVDGGSRGALAANLDAAAEVARQLRLRRVGGPVIVDFVSMEGTAHRERVRAALAEAAARDSAPVQLLGWTRLGHLELIRPRQEPALADLLPADTRPAETRDVPEGERRALATALAGLAAYAPSPPGWCLKLPPAAAAILAGAGRRIMAELEARRGEPASIAAAALPPDRFEVAPFRSGPARPIS